MDAASDDAFDSFLEDPDVEPQSSQVGRRIVPRRLIDEDPVLNDESTYFS